MFKRTITICLTVAALGAGVTACGGDSADEPAAAKAPAAAAGGTAVSVQDNSYSPADLKVAVGDTVTFTNEGAIAHTVTATEGADFDSGSMDSGATFEFTAEKAGTVSYVCTFHAGMTGTIEVG